MCCTASVAGAAGLIAGVVCACVTGASAVPSISRVATGPKAGKSLTKVGDGIDGDMSNDDKNAANASYVACRNCLAYKSELKC